MAEISAGILVQRIEITRGQFEEQFGVKPDPNYLGMVFLSDDGYTVLEEYVFTDEPLLADAILEIAELHRLYSLTDKRVHHA